MKYLLSLLLALCAVFSVHAVTEELSQGSVNFTCDLTKYNSSVTPPSPTVNCSNGVMTIYISKCQLEKSLFNTSNLSLLNNTGSECASQNYLLDGEVQVGFHNPMTVAKCGNFISMNATHVIYSNILHIYPEQVPILTRNNATVNLSCIYPLNYPVALNMTIKPIIGSTGLSVPGVTGEVTVTMAIYTESTFTTAVTESTTLRVEDTVYIQVWMPNLDASSFSIKVTRIYATPGGMTPTGGTLYNLTSGSNGCPDPQYGVDLISVLQNGNSSQARFAMKVFKITNSDSVNLYADVTICTPNCVAICNAKIGRSSIPGNVASVNVQLNAEGAYTSGAADRFSFSWTMVSLISFLLFANLM